LFACSPQKIEISEAPRVPLNLADPDALSLRPVEYLVVTKDNFLESMKSARQEPVLFCVDGTDYKNMSLNLQDIMFFLITQKDQIKKYKEYYETPILEPEPKNH
jgi:hypothetical protein